MVHPFYGIIPSLNQDDIKAARKSGYSEGSRHLIPIDVGT
jgi:hypothetical protein